MRRIEVAFLASKLKKGVISKNKATMVTNKVFQGRTKLNNLYPKLHVVNKSINLTSLKFS